MSKLVDELYSEIEQYRKSLARILKWAGQHSENVWGMEGDVEISVQGDGEELFDALCEAGFDLNGDGSLSDGLYSLVVRLAKELDAEQRHKLTNELLSDRSLLGQVKTCIIALDPKECHELAHFALGIDVSHSVKIHEIDGRVSYTWGKHYWGGQIHHLSEYDLKGRIMTFAAALRYKHEQKCARWREIMKQKAPHELTPAERREFANLTESVLGFEHKTMFVDGELANE